MSTMNQKQSTAKIQLRCSLLAVVATLSLLLNPVAAIAEDFVVGVVPQYEAKRLHAVWQPVLQNLADRTGHHFHLQGNASIPEFEVDFERGEFDLIYANPWHAVIAHEKQGYVPVIKDASRKLKGILVVNKASPIESVEQLDGQEIAFPAPNALGASLLMRADLKLLYDVNIKPVYVDTHPSVYLNVLLGSTRAGGGVMRTLKEQPDKVRDKLRVLYETRPINPHPISVHPRVSVADREKIQSAFLAMSRDAETKDLLPKTGIKQAQAASLDDYTVLESWGLRDFYVAH